MAEGKVTVLTILPEKFNLHLENYKKPNLLYCYNGGYFLRVLPNGAVDGIRDRSDKHNTDRRMLLSGNARRKPLHHVKGSVRI
ncbi:fibroblast growth factor 1-like isoform X4 [Acipenser ruthenus]|uniref:fibroblast growth factor 1-like isoform X4 n=1 Tax=Acipenser ruthenus TaxID=7906 RepID=UPI0027418D7C|nr:fibroblast growth factor 1-like isoform X4 [Acipenser ruthenus]